MGRAARATGCRDTVFIDVAAQLVQTTRDHQLLDRQGPRYRFDAYQARLPHAALAVRAVDGDALPRLTAALGTTEGWALLSFLKLPHGGLNGITPRQAIEQGQSGRVIKIAEHEGN